MDHNTLMFIANGGLGKPMPSPNQKLLKPTTPGPCYGCGGDHWYRDCPNKKDKPTGIPPIRRFCLDCAIKHLIQDCPSNPELKGKANLNYVEIIHASSPSSSETEQVVPIKVITRAQAKAQGQQANDEAKIEKSVRAKRSFRYRKNKQKLRDENKKQKAETPEEKESEDIELQPHQKHQKETLGQRESKKKSIESGGSVLAEKHMETLDALLKAYKARLRATETLEQRWRRYPDPKNEARQLEIYRRLLETTQALINQLAQSKEPKPVRPRSTVRIPTMETEVSSV